jgi:hypothetical protein
MRFNRNQEFSTLNDILPIQTDSGLSGVNSKNVSYLTLSDLTKLDSKVIWTIKLLIILSVCSLILSLVNITNKFSYIFHIDGVFSTGIIAAGATLPTLGILVPYKNYLHLPPFLYSAVQFNLIPKLILACVYIIQKTNELKSSFYSETYWVLNTDCEFISDICLLCSIVKLDVYQVLWNTSSFNQILIFKCFLVLTLLLRHLIGVGIILLCFEGFFRTVVNLILIRKLSLWMWFSSNNNYSISNKSSISIMLPVITVKEFALFVQVLIVIFTDWNDVKANAYNLITSNMASMLLWSTLVIFFAQNVVYQQSLLLESHPKKHLHGEDNVNAELERNIDLASIRLQRVGHSYRFDLNDILYSRPSFIPRYITSGQEDLGLENESLSDSTRSEDRNIGANATELENADNISSNGENNNILFDSNIQETEMVINQIPGELKANYSAISSHDVNSRGHTIGLQTSQHGDNHSDNWDIATEVTYSHHDRKNFTEVGMWLYRLQ